MNTRSTKKERPTDLTRQNCRAKAENPQSYGGPATPPPSELASVLARNIRVMGRRREREEATASSEERIAGAITRFSGSMRFVYLHIVLFGFWIMVNLGLVPGMPEFDPSLVILAMVASVEAIFLSTFILITQNRMSAAAEKRAELDLQISLLAEHEVTKLATLLSAIAGRLGIEIEHDPDVEEVKRDVAPEVVLDAIEGTEERRE